MKKIQVKLSGKWRDVIYVRGGYVDMHKDVDGVFASLRLEPEEADSEGCSFRAIDDIRLVDESECEHEEGVEVNIAGIPSEGLYICPKCKEPVEFEVKPKKIEKLDLGSITNGYNSLEIFKLRDKINEIVDYLNDR